MFEQRLRTGWVWLFSIATIVACSLSDEPTAPQRAVFVWLSPQATTVLQGDSSTHRVNLSTNGAFSGVPQLTITGAPSGVVARIDVIQSSSSIASAVIVINVGSQAAPGAYALSLVVSDPGADPVITSLSLRVVFREPPCTLTDLCAQWARAATASSEYDSEYWSAHEATGVPNVTGCSDDPHAWASAEPDDGQWLELEFEHSVYPTRVEVFENYGTSSIVKVELRDEASTYHTVYSATPQVLDCPRTLVIPVSNVDVKIRSVRIHFDQERINDWNEVDAVKLVGFRQK